MGDLGRKALLTFGVAGLVAFGAQPARADICDLTSGGSCTINSGIFTTDYQHPTGTGVIDSFLRLQQKPAEQGYNTSARSYGSKTQFDEKTDPNYTRNLLVADLGTQTLNGKTYVEFFLDANEPGSTDATKYLVTLDQLEIFVSNTPNLDKYTNTGGDGANNGSGTLGNIAGTGTSTKIYDLDTNSKDNWVNLSYVLYGQGSGSSDMSFLLDQSLFAGYTYVYLYSQFGDYSPSDKVGSVTTQDYKYPAEAGFEEWFSGGDPTSVPEPATLLLLGCGLALYVRRLRQA